jgi:hypothetical protein
MPIVLAILRIFYPKDCNEVQLWSAKLLSVSILQLVLKKLGHMQ